MATDVRTRGPDVRSGLKARVTRLGFDRAGLYGVVWRVWMLAAGPVTLVLIARRVSVEAQG